MRANWQELPFTKCAVIQDVFASGIDLAESITALLVEKIAQHGQVKAYQFLDGHSGRKWLQSVPDLSR